MANIVSEVEKTILQKRNTDALKDLGLSFDIIFGILSTNSLHRREENIKKKKKKDCNGFEYSPLSKCIIYSLEYTRERALSISCTLGVIQPTIMGKASRFPT